MTQHVDATGGGRGRPPLHHLVRRGVVLALIAMIGSGCATKRDIRDVREDLQRLEAQQDSIYGLLQTQNRQILDSLTVTTERLLNVRGELANQLSQLQDQLVRVGELTGQVQVRLNQLDQELAGALRRVNAAGGGVAPDTAAGEAERLEEGAVELYEVGREQASRGNAATARQAFQMVVDSFPADPIAAEAQLQIGETYAREGQYDAAIRALERVVERYQDSDAAPRALYRAGVISQERGQIDRAREYFRRVLSGYPGSDARLLAERALERSGGG